MNKGDCKQDFILLNTGYAYHDADWNWKNVYSPFARIHYVVNGMAKIVQENSEYTITKGHLYLTPPYTKHSYICDGVLELNYIHIYEDLGKNISFFDLMDFPVEVEAYSYDTLLISRLIEINPGRELSHYDPRTYDNSSNLTKNMRRQKDIALVSELETQRNLKASFFQVRSPCLIQK